MFEKYKIQCSKYVEVPSPPGKDKVYITEEGQIFSLEKGLLPIGYDHKGNKIINLNLWNGKKDYLVSLISLVTFGKLKLQTIYYDKVEPFHIDGNKNNLHPSNLGYRYTQPIECEFEPGFYYIPFFNAYVINKKGIVKNWKTGKKAITYVFKNDGKFNVKGGYRFFTLHSDIGNFRIGRYRLLALTFLPYPDNVDKLTVNHKDGNPPNDDLDNLEWASYQDNVLHAYANGLRSQNFVIYAKNVFTGEEIEFFSCQEASRKTTINVHVITRTINSNDQKLCKDGWLFKKDSTVPWREVLNPRKELKALPNLKKVMSKNVFTGEIKEHKSISQVGKDLNLKSNSAAVAQMSKDHNRPYCGYLFKLDSDNTPWPEFSERQLAVFRDNPTGHARGVLAINDKGEELFFTNIKKASAHFQHILKSKNDVIKAIARNRNVDGYKLRYYE